MAYALRTSAMELKQSEGTGAITERKGVTSYWPFVCTGVIRSMNLSSEQERRRSQFQPLKRCRLLSRPFATAVMRYASGAGTPPRVRDLRRVIDGGEVFPRRLPILVYGSR